MTKAGDYTVKVAATSQGDSDKLAEISTTTTILPIYDVSIVGIGDLTSETSDASDGVSYKFTISNTGKTDDIIDLSTSGDVSGTLSQTTVPLSDGSSTEVTLTILGSALTKAGDYTVKVIATSQGDSDKLAEISTTTTILPIYDVSIVGIGDLISETSDASDGVSYKFTVTNTGNTDDTIILSSSNDTISTLSQSSISLASGASTEITLAINGVSLTSAGDYVVKVTATSQGDIEKIAELTTTTTILPVYGVSLAGVDNLITETTDAGDGISYKITVTNTGNTDDTISLSSSGDVVSTLSQSSVSLASGASTEITLTINEVSLTSAGDYVVKVTATSQGDIEKIAELTTTTTILPVYGVSLAGVDNLITETTDAGDGISYKITVTNTGNTEDTIILSSSDDTVSTLSQSSVSLLSGASTEMTLTVSANALTTAGDYEVSITATSQGDNTKTDVITTTTTILPVYGVVLEGVGDLTTETNNANNGVRYTLTITNTGNTEDTFVLTSSDNTATINQTLVTIGANASEVVTLTIPASSLAIAGNYIVKVTATSQGDNTKSTEISTITSILPVYDVAISGLMKLSSDPSDADAGINYQFTVINKGNTDDVINLSLSDDALVTLNLNSISLASGTSQEVILTVSADALSTAGEFEVKVTATSQEDPTITAETTISTSIDPVYGVMFEGADQLVGSTMDILEGISYQLTLTNTGNIEDTILLSSSAEVGIEGSVLGSFIASKDQEISTSQVEITLNPGSSTTLTFIVAGDSFTRPGAFEIIVTATSQGDSGKTAEVTTTTTFLPVYDISISTPEIQTEITDGSVSYKFTVSNNGNTDDIFNLSSTGEATSTLSQNSVSLPPGLSMEIILTISTADLIAGDYAVTVTGTSQGDSTITAESEISIAIGTVYGVMLSSEDKLQGNTIDILTGVSYQLTLTNTGNIEDTILLSSSAEVGIEGSVLGSFIASKDQEISTGQVEMTLNPRSSATLTFIVVGDSFTRPGAYEITVTATSQGDTAKSANIITTTTINPVVWDLNADGIINILDLVSVSNQFGKFGEDLIGDVNMDGTVNILDLVQVASYFGKSQVEIIEAMQ